MAKKAKVKRPLQELASPFEKWLRKSVGPGVKFAPISRALLEELEEKLEATDSEEEKTRLCREFLKAAIKGN